MQAEIGNVRPYDIRSAWDEDRTIVRVTARGFVFDDAMDRIVWAMDHAGDRAVAVLASGAAAA
ncbi:hypothetical protein Y025_1243 [Burkholderia pseudomallei TSV32]|nr:hypothetical protein Y025_1243 [Burkholderia pseudomallei TSV32]